MAGRQAELFGKISDEILRQDHKFGQQNYRASWYSFERAQQKLGRAREVVDQRMGTDRLTWHNILREELYEAIVECDLQKQTEELIQCAAVILQWIMSNDRKIAAQTSQGDTNGNI